MEASKITVSDKTYDLNYLNRKKKTDLRRKLVIELIESKPAGTIIKMDEIAEVCRFKQRQGADHLIAKMIRDGVIGRYESDRKKRYYYAVIGSVRVRRDSQATPGQPSYAGTVPTITATSGKYDFTDAITNLKAAGLRFTITISNEDK